MYLYFSWIWSVKKQSVDDVMFSSEIALGSFFLGPVGGSRGTTHYVRGSSFMWFGSELEEPKWGTSGRMEDGSSRVRICEIGSKEE